MQTGQLASRVSMKFWALSKATPKRLLNTLRAGLLLLPLLSVPQCLLAQSTEWDTDFQDATFRYLYAYLPDGDWKWFKAQCIQESRLRPDAVSPAGAVGLCQLMVGAATDAGITPAERYEARKNIKASAWILRRNIRTWYPRETRFQRLQLGWASYNAGAGNIIKAQTRSGGKMLWPDIAPHLSAITGHDNARETLHYVQIIPQHYRGIRD